MSLIKNENHSNFPSTSLEGLLESMLGNRYGVPATTASDYRRVSSSAVPIDTFTDDHHYYVVAELPGVAKADIDLKLENAVLTLSGKRNLRGTEGERSVGFSRAITIGDDVNADAIVAKLENGLLTIALPKAEQRKPKAINII